MSQMRMDSCSCHTASSSGVLPVESRYPVGVKRKTLSTFFITDIVLASVQPKIVMEII